MVLHSGDPHSWSNSLAHATFDDNVDRVGKDTALQFLREDIRSWIRERKGQSSQWSLRVQDGKMVTETGVSLQEMTNNVTNGPHSDLVPESIKATAPLEAATLAEATRLAMEGADRIIFPEQHLNEQGEVIARFLSVWTKDAAEPTLYRGSRIDLGKSFHIEDVRTGTAFSAFQDGQALSFHEHKEQKHAFVLAVQNEPKQSFEAVKESITTAVHRSHQETYGATPRFETYAKEETVRHEVFDKTKTVIATDTPRLHDTDLFIQAPRAVVRETMATARGVAVLLHDKEKRRELVRKVRRIFGREDRLVDNRNAVAFLLSMEQESGRLTIEKIREKPVRIVEVIEKRHEKMKKGMVMLGVIAETGVAIHAAPVILARLAEKLPTPVVAIKKSIERHAKKELRRKNSLEKTRDKKELRKTKQESKKDSVKVQPLKPERVEPLRRAKERKWRKKRSSENGIKKVAAASEIIPSASKKRERREKRKMRKAVEKSMRRHKKKELQMENKVQPLIEKKRSIQKKEREAVGEMVFGWMVWMILTRKDSETPKNNLKRSHPALQGETLRRQEVTLWILLSIIYYLTAIREQGMHNYPIKKKRRTLPKKGIIFSFAS